MAIQIEIRPKAQKDLAAIPQIDAARIVHAIRSLGEAQSGDVKKLSNHDPAYRLRVGNWRVLFDFDKDKIIIYRIRNRRDAY
jgi:mRNA interferase RelE/StbE